MKIAVLNSNFCQDLATLKAIPFLSINHNDKKMVEGSCYEYFTGATEGITPDDIPADTKGRWVHKGFAHKLCFIVEDNYDFIGNDAKNLTDTDENIILNMDKYGALMIGSFENFRDYLCCRTEIKEAIGRLAGANWSNYSLLPQDIRTIASRYVPTKIVDNAGIVQLATDCLGDIATMQKRLNDGMVYNGQARSIRYSVMVNYAYSKLGKVDGLTAEDVVLSNNLIHKYVERGRMRQSDEGGLDGLVDWLEGTDNYVVDGLKSQIIAGDLTIKDSTTTEDFITKCVDIVENGRY